MDEQAISFWYVHHMYNRTANVTLYAEADSTVLLAIGQGRRVMSMQLGHVGSGFVSYASHVWSTVSICFRREPSWSGAIV
jgi:hypothetical protein